MTRANIKNTLEDYTNTTLFDIWNSYCEEVGYNDDRVEYTKDVIEYSSKETLIDLAKNCDNVDFCDTYFVYGTYYWQYKTSDDVIDLIDLDELADYIMDNPDFAESCGFEIEEDEDDSEDE